MHRRILWARTLTLAACFTLLVSGTLASSASAHATKRSACRSGPSRCSRSSTSPKAYGTSVSTIRAGHHKGQTRGATLIFGDGDEIGGNPSEPLTNLQNILTEAGYSVDVSSTLPSSLTQYKAIWYIDTSALSTSAETKLEAFVNAGHGLFLTGERPCCDSLNNASDSSIINSLVTGGGVQVGGLGDADSETAANPVNSAAVDSVAQIPNVLSTWTPNEPGGMAGVASDNVLTSTNFSGQPTATGAVWDGSSLNAGSGRLAILMDINWLESSFWDQPTATAIAVNLERFLMATTPVHTASNPQMVGYAAVSTGVRDVQGQWTVPTVDCSLDATASAVGVWVGIDGFGNSSLVKAGLGVTCASPTSSPCYYLFTEVKPGIENPFTDCSAVEPGDVIATDISNTPFGSSTFRVTISDNGTQVTAPISLTEPTKRDKSAECVVQLPPGSVGPTPARYKALADFGSVSFTNCQATATENAGDSLDTDQLAMGSDGAFSVSALNLEFHHKSLATVGVADWPNAAWSVTWAKAH